MFYVNFKLVINVLIVCLFMIWLDTWWSSDAAAVLCDSRVCVRCLNPHEGVALQVAPHMPGWLLHFSPWCSSSHLMILACAACSASSICMYQSDFASPSPCVGGIWAYLYLMYQKSLCISPDDYSRHSMYVGSIILFFWLLFTPAYSSWFSPLFTGLPIICTLSRRA